MKKTLLGLGLLPLVILPTIAVASCSATEGPAVPTLETEVAKFKDLVKAKDSTMTAAEAAAKIVPSQSPEKKLEALKSIATTIPTLDTGFTMIVNSARENTKTSTWVDVKITITETKSQKKQDVTLTITDFSTFLNSVASLFTPTILRPDITLTVTEALTTINDNANTQADKLKALETWVEWPNGFTANSFDILIGDVKNDGEQTLFVPLTLSQKVNRAIPAINFSWVIRGFGTKLDKEAVKFQTPTTAKNKEITAVTAAATIKTTETAEERFAALNLIATTVPELSTDFSMTVNSATASATDHTAVEVSITITEKSSTNTKNVVFTITGFPTNLDLLVKTFETTEGVAKIPVETAIISANTINNAADKLAKLKEIADLPEFDEKQFTITFKPNPATATGNKVAVALTLAEKVAGRVVNTREVTWTIGGFISPELDAASNLFIKTPGVAKAPTGTAQSAIEKLNASGTTQDAKLLALKSLADWPQDFTEANFNITVGEALLGSDPINTIIVQLTLQEKVAQDTTSKTINWTIGGFISPALDAAANSFKTPGVAKIAETALAAVKTINEATDKLTTLESIATLPPTFVKDQFTITFNMPISAVATGNSIDVTFTLTEKNAGRAASSKEVTWTIGGFISPALAAAANLFTPEGSVKASAGTALAAIIAIDTTASTPEAKLSELIKIANWPNGFIDTNFNIVVGKATQIGTTNKITVVLTLAEQTTPNITKEVTWTIGGFISPALDAAASLFKTPGVAKIAETALAAEKTINEATDKLATLESITTLPDYGKGQFTITFKPNPVVATGNKVAVTLVLTEIGASGAGSSKEVTWTIGGFISSTLEDAAKLFTPEGTAKEPIVSVTTALTTLNAVGITPEAKLSELIKIANWPNGFTDTNFNIVVVGEAIQGPTTNKITVVLTLAEQTTPNITKEVTWTISGFISPALDAAASLFKTPGVAIQPATTAAAAAQTINSAPGESGKLAALESIATWPPTFDKNQFTIRIRQNPAGAIGDSINVTFTLVEKGVIGAGISKEVIWIIGGFISPLDAAANLFKTPGVAKIVETALAAAQMINNGASNELKLEALESIATLPPTFVKDQFTITFKMPISAVATGNSIDVTFTLTEKNAGRAATSKEVTWTIGGFISPLDAAANSFKTPGVAIQPATTAAAAAQMINAVAGNVDKLAELEKITNLPVDFEKNNFSIEFSSSAPAAEKGNSITVTFTLTEKIAGRTVTSKEITWIINGFISKALDEAAKLFTNTPGVAIQPATTATTAASAINAAIDDKTKLEALLTITTLPASFDQNKFSITFKAHPEVVAVPTGNSITVTFTLTEKIAGRAATSKEVTWIIDGFISPALDEAAKLFTNTPGVTIQPATTATTAASTINEAADKLTTLESIATWPPTFDQNKFSITFKPHPEVVAVPTDNSITVTFTLTEIVAGRAATSKEVTWTINGFTPEAPAL